MLWCTAPATPWPSDCAQSPVSTSCYQLTLKDTRAQPKAISSIFLGQLDAYRNMDICDKKMPSELSTFCVCSDYLGNTTSSRLKK